MNVAIYYDIGKPWEVGKMDAKPSLRCLFGIWICRSGAQDRGQGRKCMIGNHEVFKFVTR